MLDSIADSVFVKIGWVGQILSTNTVSEQKIPITILILKRGPCPLKPKAASIAPSFWTLLSSAVREQLDRSQLSWIVGALVPASQSENTIWTRGGGVI